MAGGPLFTPVESKVLLTNYPTCGIRAVAKMLGRSYASIKSKARRLGLLRVNRKQFTRQEISIIKQRYVRDGANALARRLKRNPESVMAKAHEFNLHYSGQPKLYTRKERQVIRRTYLASGAKEVGRRLKRSPSSVVMQAKKLGLKCRLEHRLKLHPVTLSQVELAYLAGLIDGEGSVTIKRAGGKAKIRNRLVPMVLVSNTAEVMITWLRERFLTPNVVVTSQNRTKKNPRHLRVWVFSFRGLQYLPLYQALLPHLTVKRPHMELLIELVKTRLSQQRRVPITPREEKLHRMLRFMNGRLLRMSNSEKLRIYQSSTWEPVLERMKRMGF